MKKLFTMFLALVMIAGTLAIAGTPVAAYYVDPHDSDGSYYNDRYDSYYYGFYNITGDWLYRSYYYEDKPRPYCPYDTNIEIISYLGSAEYVSVPAYLFYEERTTYTRPGAFAENTQLKRVYFETIETDYLDGGYWFPLNAAEIGPNAFLNCTSLEAVAIPSNMGVVYESAFTGCTSLRDIYIVKDYAYVSPTIIRDGNGIFDNVTFHVLEFYEFSYEDFLGLNYNSYTPAEWEYAMQEDGTAVITRYNGAPNSSIEIPDMIDGYTVGMLGSKLANGSFLTSANQDLAPLVSSVTIPDSVTSIGSYTFNDCSSLTTVYYTGTSAQWNEITIHSYNAPLQNANKVFLGERTVSLLSGGVDTQLNTVAAGSVFTFPACPFAAPEGTVFTGWLVGGEVYAAGDPIFVDQYISATAIFTDVEANSAVQMGAGGDSSKTRADLYFTIPEGADPDEFDVVFNGVTTNLGDMTPGANGYRFSITSPAKNMGDKISYSLVCNGETVKSGAVSVADYASMLATYYPDYAEVADAMLAYGAAAQNYFGYDTEHPVSNTVVSTPVTGAAFDSAGAAAYTQGDASIPVVYTAMNVTFLSDTTLSLALRIKDGFTNDEALSWVASNVRLDGAAMTAEIKENSNGVKFVIVSKQNISIGNITKNMTLSLGTQTYQLSVLNYFVAAEKTSNDSLKALTRALYAYAQAVSAIAG